MTPKKYQSVWEDLVRCGLGDRLWEESVARVGFNEIHPEASKPSLARRRVAKTITPGLASESLSEED